MSDVRNQRSAVPSPGFVLTDDGVLILKRLLDLQKLAAQAREVLWDPLQASEALRQIESGVTQIIQEINRNEVSSLTTPYDLSPNHSEEVRA